MQQQSGALATNHSQENRYLLFLVKGQYYGIELTSVLEIIEMLPITKIPGIPHCIKGIVNIRGSIVSVIDIRARFGFEQIPYTDRTCVIIVDNEGVSVGIIVDQVVGVANISQDEISAPPNDTMAKTDSYIKGIGRLNDETQLLLDCAQLLNVC